MDTERKYFRRGHWDAMLRVGYQSFASWITVRKKAGRVVTHRIDAHGFATWCMEDIEQAAADDSLPITECIAGVRTAGDLVRAVQVARLEVAETRKELNRLRLESLTLRDELMDRGPLMQLRDALLMALNAEPVRPVSGVYFLLAGSEVVYVGQSTNVASRMSGHRLKEHDRIVMIRVPVDQLLSVEAGFIRALQPKLNRTRNGNSVAA